MKFLTIIIFSLLAFQSLSVIIKQTNLLATKNAAQAENTAENTV